MVFSNQSVYNFLRQVALVWLPAAATLYVFLAHTWFWGHTEQVVGTISGVDTFLGAVLHISSKSYAKQAAEPDGHLVIDKSDPNKDTYSLQLSTPIDDIDKKDSIKLTVVQGAS